MEFRSDKNDEEVVILQDIKNDVKSLENDPEGFWKQVKEEAGGKQIYIGQNALRLIAKRTDKIPDGIQYDESKFAELTAKFANSVKPKEEIEITANSSEPKEETEIIVKNKNNDAEATRVSFADKANENVYGLFHTVKKQDGMFEKEYGVKIDLESKFESEGKSRSQSGVATICDENVYNFFENSGYKGEDWGNRIIIDSEHKVVKIAIDTAKGKFEVGKDYSFKAQVKDRNLFLQFNAQGVQIAEQVKNGRKTSLKVIESISYGRTEEIELSAKHIENIVSGKIKGGLTPQIIDYVARHPKEFENSGISAFSEILEGTKNEKLQHLKLLICPDQTNGKKIFAYLGGRKGIYELSSITNPDAFLDPKDITKEKGNVLIFTKPKESTKGEKQEIDHYIVYLNKNDTEKHKEALINFLNKAKGQVNGKDLLLNNDKVIELYGKDLGSTNGNYQVLPSEESSYAVQDFNFAEQNSLKNQENLTEEISSGNGNKDLEDREIDESSSGGNPPPADKPQKQDSTQLEGQTEDPEVSQNSQNVANENSDKAYVYPSRGKYLAMGILLGAFALIALFTGLAGLLPMCVAFGSLAVGMGTVMAAEVTADAGAGRMEVSLAGEGKPSRIKSKDREARKEKRKEKRNERKAKRNKKQKKSKEKDDDNTPPDIPPGAGSNVISSINNETTEHADDEQAEEILAETLTDENQTEDTTELDEQEQETTETSNEVTNETSEEPQVEDAASAEQSDSEEVEPETNETVVNALTEAAASTAQSQEAQKDEALTRYVNRLNKEIEEQRDEAISNGDWNPSNNSPKTRDDDGRDGQ